MNDIFEKPFTWNNREHFLKALSHKEQVRFALLCATQVKHLMTDERSLGVLEVVELYLEGKASKEECREASEGTTSSSAARAAAYTADAAWCPAYFPLCAATYANYAAGHAAKALPEEQTKEEQMNYLRDLLLENLSEEDKECWLLVASI